MGQPVGAATCAVCSQPVHWTGQEWEHRATGAWANAPVRHRAMPTANAAPAGQSPTLKVER